jgi:FkbH-like protein
MMKVLEALEILGKVPVDGAEEFRVFLGCSFTPLHLKTLLAARLQLSRPGHRVSVETGVYGDLLGNLAKAVESKSDTAVTVIEWHDIDPRLGVRSLGGWAPRVLPDIVENAKDRSASIVKAMERLAKEMPVVLAFATLPLPPIAYTAGAQASSFEIELRSIVAAAAAQVAKLSNVKLVNSQRLDSLSPLEQRFDVKSEVLNGFPYRVPYADVLADLLSRLAHNAAAKKGLITDLDDTLWKGILGEAGAQGVSWDLDHHSHMHGVYQQFLQALSASGVLVGIASKNDAKFVDEVFDKRSPILSKDEVFPIEASWRAKSEAVGKILKAWNIGAGDVVFVDDSPMELAEVKAAHPEIECVRFPQDDPQGVYELVWRLRDLFGKSTLQEEDSIRLESLRLTNSLRSTDEASGSDTEGFLERAEAELAIAYSNRTLDPRALELVNKTNQFNLNGKRHTAASLQKYLNDPQAFLMVVSYKDKFGPLGKIAVLAGRHIGKKMWIDAWVMSCRAFSRRIEHRCFEELIARFGVDEVELDFGSTPRNEPFHSFLTESLGGAGESPSHVSRLEFLKRQKKTYHRVLELING